MLFRDMWHSLIALTRLLKQCGEVKRNGFYETDVPEGFMLIFASDIVSLKAYWKAGVRRRALCRGLFAVI